MISITFTAEASDFSSETQIADFFNGLAQSFKAVRSQLAGAAAAAIISAAPAAFAASQANAAHHPAHAEPAVDMTHEAEPVPAVEPPKRGRKSKAEAAPAVEAPKAEATKAAPVETPTLDALRAAANRCIAEDGAELVAAGMKILGAVKFAEIKEEHRAAAIQYFGSNGEFDLVSAISLASDAASIYG